jgi:hypothetical protein
MRPTAHQGLLAVPIVLHAGVVHDELVVEPHARAGPYLHDPEPIPFTERLVGRDERILAGSARRVVPQAARAFVGANLELLGLGRVPDLHLGRGPQVDATVGLGHRLVVHPELDVAEVLDRGEIRPLAVVDEHAIDHLPVGVDARLILGEEGRLLLGRLGGELVRVLGAHPPPAGQIPAVAQGPVARRRLVGLRLFSREGMHRWDRAGDEANRDQQVQHSRHDVFSAAGRHAG